MDLEKLWGSNGCDVLVAHPSIKEENTYLNAIGSRIIKHNLSDPLNEQYLRGHSAEISSLAITASTPTLLASGQKQDGVSESNPIIVWELDKSQPLYKLHGLRSDVKNISFSGDHKFLVASDNDTIALWEVATGELVWKLRSPMISFIRWSPICPGVFAYGCGSDIFLAMVQFNYTSMGFVVMQSKAQPPSSSYLRVYTCGIFTNDGSGLICGSAAGELCAFSIPPISIPSSSAAVSPAAVPQPVFRHAQTLSNNGVHSLCSIRVPLPPNNAPSVAASYGTIIAVGSGAGSVQFFVCHGQALQLDFLSGPHPLPGSLSKRNPIVSLCPTASHTLLLAATLQGSLCVMDLDPLFAQLRSSPISVSRPAGSGLVSLRTKLLTASHAAPVVALAASPSDASIVATTSLDCSVAVWTLDGLAPLHRFSDGSAHAQLTETAVSELGHTSLNRGLPSALAGASVGALNAASNLSQPTAVALAPAQAPADAVISSSAGNSRTFSEIELYVGYADGSVRLFPLPPAAASPAEQQMIAQQMGLLQRGKPGTELFRLNAHGAQVSALCCTRGYMVSGGDDGAVNVWKRLWPLSSPGAPIAHFKEHRGRVLAVQADLAFPEMIYSLGADKQLVSMSLRSGRPVAHFPFPSRTVNGPGISGNQNRSFLGQKQMMNSSSLGNQAGGAFTALGQLHGPLYDGEIIVGSTDGRLVIFDPQIGAVNVGAVDIALMLNMPPGPAPEGLSVTALSVFNPSYSATSSSGGVQSQDLRLSLVVVGTRCGKIIVLRVPPSAPSYAEVTPAVHRPIQANGVAQQVPNSLVSKMEIVDVFETDLNINAITWTVDGRQIVVTGHENAMMLLNWFDSK